MPADLPRIDIEYVIVCDDIRREDNGKELLIGVYTRDIVVGAFPAVLQLAFWICYVPTALGTIETEFRLVDEQDAEFFKGKTSSQIDVIARSSIRLAGLPVPLQIPGTLRFQSRTREDEDWTTVKTIGVLKGQVKGRPR